MSYEVSIYPVEKLGPNAEILPGFAFKSERFTETPNDIPLVKGENVHQGFIDWNGAKYWSADEYDSLSKYHLIPGDIVLAMDRPWVTAGLKWSYIKPHDPKALLVQRVARIRAKKNLNQDYLRHVISSNYFANYIQPIVTGVNVPHISGKQIGAFRIPIPSPETQRKIAAILTAYDDLIETNKRRIALLEKMAEELYREWFVRMRFPGHQNTKFVKGVPVAWEVRELKKCAAVNPSSLGRNDRPEIIHYVDIGSVTTNHIGDIHTLPLGEAPGRAKRRVQHGDIIWSSVRPANRAYCLIYRPTENLIVSTGFAVIRPNRETPFTFLNFVVTSNGFVDQMTAVAKGAAYPATSFDDFEKAKLLWPGKELLAAFHDQCEPLFQQKHNLTEQNQTLTRTRDLLLPRLISGKLSVEALDIQFPPSMREGV